MLHGAHPAPDIQQRHALHRLAAQGIDQCASGRVRPATTVPLELLRRVGRVEPGLDPLALARRHRQTVAGRSRASTAATRSASPGSVALATPEVVDAAVNLSPTSRDPGASDSQRSSRLLTDRETTAPERLVVGHHLPHLGFTERLVGTDGRFRHGPSGRWCGPPTRPGSRSRRRRRPAPAGLGRASSPCGTTGSALHGRAWRWSNGRRPTGRPAVAGTSSELASGHAAIGRRPGPRVCSWALHRAGRHTSHETAGSRFSSRSGDLMWRPCTTPGTHAGSISCGRARGGPKLWTCRTRAQDQRAVAGDETWRRPMGWACARSGSPIDAQDGDVVASEGACCPRAPPRQRAAGSVPESDGRG